MIFSKKHIEMIKAGIKTQTRRKSNVYVPGQAYTIQPGRGKRGITDGVIVITRKRIEYNLERYLQPSPVSFRAHMLSHSDAEAEGSYTQAEYEKLYSLMYKNWEIRYAYTFVYVEVDFGEASP